MNVSSERGEGITQPSTAYELATVDRSVAALHAIRSVTAIEED
jgi:hypothetical protein